MLSSGVDIEDVVGENYSGRRQEGHLQANLNAYPNMYALARVVYTRDNYIAL